MRTTTAFLAAAVLTINVLAPAAAQNRSLARHDTTWLKGGDYRLRVKTFRSATLSAHPILLVVLHGDAPRSRPDYHDVFASRAAAANSDVVAAAILRPGYTDPEGHQSEGVRGETTGDNYNTKNTQALAQVIQQLKARHGARKVIVAGHSGGAALTANILGLDAKLIDTALLVSCPCDVSKWRAHMFGVTKYAGFQGQVETLSPIQTVAHLSSAAEIVMVVGSRDDVTPPELTKDYAAAGTASGKNIRVIVIPEKGH